MFLDSDGLWSLVLGPRDYGRLSLGATCAFNAGTGAMNLVLPAKHPAASEELEAFHSEQKSLTSHCVTAFFPYDRMHFSIFPVYHNAFFPVYHNAIFPVYHNAIFPVYHNAIFPVYHNAIFPVYHNAIFCSRRLAPPSHLEAPFIIMQFFPFITMQFFPFIIMHFFPFNLS